MKDLMHLEKPRCVLPATSKTVFDIFLAVRLTLQHNGQADKAEEYYVRFDALYRRKQFVETKELAKEYVSFN